jgi:hypothetical protein
VQGYSLTLDPVDDPRLKQMREEFQIDAAVVHAKSELFLRRVPMGLASCLIVVPDGKDYSRPLCLEWESSRSTGPA